MSNRDTFAGVGIGFGIGILTGAIIALLYAPKSGRELRADIKNKAHEASAAIRGKFGHGKLEDVKP